MGPSKLQQQRFRGTLLKMWLFPLVLLLALTAVLVWQIDRLLANERQISNSNEFIGQTHSVEKLLVDMETGARGYILTGEPTFLEPYENAAQLIERELDAMSNMAGDAQERELIGAVRSLKNDWQVKAQKAVAVRDGGGDYARLVATDGSKQAMDRMRELLGTLLSNKQVRRDQQTRTADRWAKMVVGLSIGVTLILGVALAAFSRRQFLRLFTTYSRALSEVESQADVLKLSEKRYRLLFENNPHPMWLYDTETLAFLEVNEAAISHYGYTREEFLAMTIKEIRPTKDIPALLEKVSHLRNRIDRAGIWKHRKKDGTLIDVEITSHVLEVSDKRAEIVLANDITSRLSAERELLELNNHLEHKVAERTKQLETANGELEAFTYSVSHDLRAPLRAINGFSRILLEDYAGAVPANAARYLDHVRNNAKQMGHLIDDLLAFSRLGRQSIKRQTVDPAAIVMRVLEELKGEQQGRSVNINMEKLPAANADPALLKQVFTNLLSNALKYTRGRSNANIDIGATFENKASDAPVYFVRDNGAGFDMKYAHKLFAVFQRLHRAEEFEGTGVGLATTERIVRRHGGRIWAEAEVDRGATFFFTIQGEPVND